MISLLHDCFYDVVSFISKFVDEKRVFAEIEYYLPQIAHLVIHLEQNSRNHGLELLTMVISQTSMHAALQLAFMFSAAMEDYQPEENGNKNPNHNPIFFNRCARLSQDLERAVICGSAVISQSEVDVLMTRASLHEADNMKDAKRSEIAEELSQHQDPDGFEGDMSGQLLYKRLERKSIFHTKPWKPYHFVVDQRVLLCFHDPHAMNPKRAFSLQNCQVEVVDSSDKYGKTVFQVVNESANVRYLLRAANEKERSLWVDFLIRQIEAAPPTVLTTRASEHVPSRASISGDVKTISEAEMSSIQRRRFRYFRQMRVFIMNMTNICERLRFKQRDVRKYFLKRDMTELIIPPFAYIPLCASTDPFHGLLRALPKECHAFSTKARCPALMLYEMEAHPDPNMDVATFLNSEIEHYDENVIIQPHCELVSSFSGTAEVHEEMPETGERPSSLDLRHEPLPTKFVIFENRSKSNGTGKSDGSTWANEGHGFERIAALGYTPPTTARSNRAESCGVHMIATIGVLKEGGTAAAQQSGAPAQGVLGETFAGKSRRIRDNSPYGHLACWSIGGLIAKSNDDVRQEVFVIQLMSYFQRSFMEASLPVWMHTYKILSTSKSTGLIELIPNAVSLDGLKKSPEYHGNMRAWYEASFGQTKELLAAALDNYISSMAAYSIVTYLLAIKDRHNGNIMINKDGYVMHIDFGFVFGFAPGKQFSMEKAPWKLTEEFVHVMGGVKSELFAEYKRRCVQCFVVARKHAKQVITLIEIMQHQSNYPAFRYNANAIRDFRSRLFMEYPENEIPRIIDRLISK